MAFSMGALFLGVDGSAAGFQNKAGAMQITLVLFAFGGLSVSLNSTQLIPVFSNKAYTQLN